MNRINIITLGTEDINNALSFYTALGFESTVEGDAEEPSIVFFKNEGTRLALYPLEKLASDISSTHPPYRQAGFPGFTLAHNVKNKEEVDLLLQKAAQAGAEIVKSPQPTDWGGYSGYFRDLDGYYWEVAYGDMWTFDESNMLVL